MIDTTPQKPRDVLRAVFARMKEGNFEIYVSVDYDGEAKESVIWANKGGSETLPPDLEAAVLALTRPLLAIEVEDMSFSKHLSGYLRLQPDESIWLNLEDITGDWDYECHIDPDDLDFHEINFDQDDLTYGFGRADLVEAYGYRIHARADKGELPDPVLKSLKESADHIPDDWTHVICDPAMMIFGGEEELRREFESYARLSFDPPRLIEKATTPEDVEPA